MCYLTLHVICNPNTIFAVKCDVNKYTASVDVEGRKSRVPTTNCGGQQIIQGSTKDGQTISSHQPHPPRLQWAPSSVSEGISGEDHKCK